MKKITIQHIDNKVKTYEVGKRFSELSDIVSNILINGDEIVIVYGAFFEVFRNCKWEYCEMYATKNPYQFAGRDKNI